MKRNFSTMSFILGMVVMALIISCVVPALALTATLDVRLNEINIRLNGAQIAGAGESMTLDNGDVVPFSIVYQGTTYLPLGRLASLLDLNVSWDSATASAVLTDASSPTPEPKDTPTLTEEEFAREVLRLTNLERAKAGLSPLSGDDALLNDAARVRAREIITLFDHTRPDGRRFSSVYDDLGVQWSSAGENLAGGQPTPEAAVKAWMESDGHRKNILRDGFTHLGVGVVLDDSGQYRIYWVQLFSSR
ncbi:MAG: CAP domain-containing protein [Oscillospiraceae bacterium]|nr:CAP domain-containing protein [Oscillospiraceae bacterium]